MYSYTLAPFRNIVKGLSVTHCMDPLLIYSVILQESGGNTWRTRFEPNYYENNKSLLPLSYSSKLGISVESEKVSQSTSWGLMQVMGVVAREMGYADLLTKLLIPDEGIAWGCQKLARLIAIHKEPDLALSAYNHGSPIENDPYVKSVNKVMAILKGENIL
jgi:hypothetical protein